MKRRSNIIGAGIALFISLLFAASAAAAPVLTVEMDHDPETIYKNDAFLSYEVVVQNSGDEPTAGQLTVSIDLPPGLTLKRAGGTGWNCSPLTSSTCASSTVVPAGAAYPILDLSEVRIDGTAGPAPSATVIAEGGGATSSAFDEDSFVFEPPVPFDLRLVEAGALDEAGDDVTQAGAHPHEAFAVFETTKLRGMADTPLVVESLHGGVVELPAGVIGNPEAIEAVCEFTEFERDNCPEEAAVGGAVAFATADGRNVPDFESARIDPVYRMPQEKGYAASFGISTLKGGGPSFVVRAKLRSDGDYGITTLIPLVPQEPNFFGANVAFCGFGAEISPPPAPGFVRCKEVEDESANPEAFVTLSTDCSIGKPLTRFAVDSWLKRGRYGDNDLPDLGDPNWRQGSFESPELTGCTQLTEEWVEEKGPSFTMQPDIQAADSPAAYTAKLDIPQEGLIDPEGLGTAHLKDTVVTLPPGLAFNPSIAHGLEACSLEQIGYMGNEFPYPNRIRFDTRLPECPEGSKIGLAEVITPVLGDPLKGSVYLAAQRANPFGSNYAVYLAIEEDDLGIVAKLPGRVDLDETTGQITATFKDNPQVPFEDLELRFFGGDRAALANPVTCGTHTVNSAFTPWSAASPDTPRPDEIARASDGVQITSGANGAPCVSDPGQRPFDVGFGAGTEQPLGGATSPFTIRVTRPDGSQELDRLEIAPPPGLVASLRGIPYCSEGQIAAAEAAESGRAERRAPSCPPASEVGTVEAGAGPGATPFYVPGKLYLAGPYRGAPLSVVAITPAVAGPFDLGNVVIRSALNVDRQTVRITAVTDPIPKVFEGIQLRIRDIRIKLDRSNWTQNPTNCDAMAVDLTAFGSNGAVRNLSNRFQVGNCEALAFKPKLKLRYKGATKRGGNPGLRAVLTQPGGQANISRTVVVLPKGSFIDNANINNPCTRAQYAAEACPKASILGRATAWSPLLDEPLTGNVYFRSNGGERELPDVVASLRGQVNVELVGFVDSLVNKKTNTSRVRNTFAVVPDAPVSRFELNLKGGKRGLIENSRHLCKGKNRADVKMRAHNGRKYDTKPVVQTDCGKKKKSKKKARK